MGDSSLFGNLGLIADLVDGVDRQECLGIIFADIVHQKAVLVLVNDGDHLHLGRLIISTDDLIQCCTAMQSVQNIINDVIQVFGNDANSALDIDTENEMIHDHTTEVCTQQAENDGLAVIAQCGGQSHGNTDFAPGQLSGISLSVDGDLLAVDDDVVLASLDSMSAKGLS